MRDAAIMLQVMSGPHPEAEHGTILDEAPDFTTRLGEGVRGLRMAWSPDFGGSIAVDSEVKEAAERAANVFQELGATVEPAPFNIDMDETRKWARHLAGMSDAQYGEHLEKQGDLLMPNVREALEYIKTITAQEYSLALGELEKIRAYVADFFTRYDILLTPTLAVPAFPCGKPPSVIAGREVNPRGGYTRYTALFNLTGNPAASVPCGFSSDGLPIGLHVVGRRYDEVTVLRASAAFEEAQPWADKRPPLS